MDNVHPTELDRIFTTKRIKSLIFLSKGKTMKIKLLLISFLLQSSLFAQLQFDYEPNAKQPYGLPNPEMPKEMLDWAPLIGECDCESISRIDQNTWADSVAMIWRFKYIMNGMAVQDETIKADGAHSGSIRQYIADSARWYVHYYSSGKPSTTLSAWEGNKNAEGEIILYKDQAAPNGTPGNYKITFSEISEKGFNWLGEWVDKTETFSYPMWKIYCKKRKQLPNEIEKQKILKHIRDFSAAYVRADYEALANAYAPNGKIFPSGTDIIEGRAAIRERWTIKDGSKVLRHIISPSEIQFFGDYAYDYGYYEGARENKDKEEKAFKGKYVIVWQKVDGEWKIYLDIWNGL